MHPTSGFTPQYEGLEALYQKHKDKGFIVLGFPCNQFGAGESGTDEEVATFCTKNFGKQAVVVVLTHDRLINTAILAGVTFPLMKKSDVNGVNTNQVYQWLKRRKSGLLGMSMIKVRIDFAIARGMMATY